MGEYEELDKKLSQQYRESVNRYNNSAPGFGDEKLYKNNLDMYRLKEREVDTLRRMQACAPPSERVKIDHTLAKTEQEAKDFGTRAIHYGRKLGKNS